VRSSQPPGEPASRRGLRSRERDPLRARSSYSPARKAVEEKQKKTDHLATKALVEALIQREKSAANQESITVAEDTQTQIIYSLEADISTLDRVLKDEKKLDEKKAQVDESNRKLSNFSIEHDESPVENDLQTHQFMGRIVEGDIINRNHVKKNTSDTLTRSILRHDSERLSELLMEIL
jgi:hypothetical protein